MTRDPTRATTGLRTTSTLALLAALTMASMGHGQKKGGQTVESVAAAKGYKVERQVPGDIDGDGVKDVVAALAKDGTITVGVFTEKGGVAELVHLFPPTGGNELKALEVRNLVPPEPFEEIVVEVYGENPDEKVKRLRVYTGYRKPREIFTTAIFRSKDKDRRDDWERLPGVVKYGDARPGWYYEDTNGDGASEIVVRRDPQLIKVERDGDDPAQLLTGVREIVYEYFGALDVAVFTERPEKRLTNFLPAYEIVDVKGSAVFVPKEELADLEADALAAAVYAATEKSADAVPDDVKIDLSPYYLRVADKNLDTAWIEGAAKGPGKGEWIELSLDEPQPIHMVRVVPGCVVDKKAFKSANVPTKIEIRFDNGERATVDLTAPKRIERPVVATSRVAIPKRDVGEQVLVFFTGDQVSKTVRITLVEAKKQGRLDQTCISEVSLH